MLWSDSPIILNSKWIRNSIILCSGTVIKYSKENCSWFTKAAQCATSFSSVVHREQYKKHNIWSGSFSAGTAVIDLSQVAWAGGFLWTWPSCITIISNCSQTSTQKYLQSKKSSDRYCMASFCTSTCSVIGAFTEAGMIQLAGGLWAEFLDLGLDSGWESTSAFSLVNRASLFCWRMQRRWW